MRCASYAIGIHQLDQGRRSRRNKMAGDRRSKDGPPVRIEGVTYRRIEARGLYAGQFMCTDIDQQATCSGIILEHVHLNSSKGGCKFQSATGSSTDVSPATCSPPEQRHVKA